MIVKRLKFVEIDGDNVVDSVVDVTEMFLILVGRKEVFCLTGCRVPVHMCDTQYKNKI